MNSSKIYHQNSLRLIKDVLLLIIINSPYIITQSKTHQDSICSNNHSKKLLICQNDIIAVKGDH